MPVKQIVEFQDVGKTYRLLQEDGVFYLEIKTPDRLGDFRWTDAASWHTIDASGFGIIAICGLVNEINRLKEDEGRCQ